MEINYAVATIERLYQLELKDIAASNRTPRGKLTANLQALAKRDNAIRLFTAELVGA